MKVGRATGAALASGALVTGSAGATVAGLVVTAHAAGACTVNSQLIDTQPLEDSGGNSFGTIKLYYDSGCRQVKGVVDTGGTHCNSQDCSGTAQIFLNGHGQGNPCHIPNNGTNCSTGWINDAGIQQYAKGQIVVGIPPNIDGFSGRTVAF